MNQEWTISWVWWITVDRDPGVRLPVLDDAAGPPRGRARPAQGLPGDPGQSEHRPGESCSIEAGGRPALRHDRRSQGRREAPDRPSAAARGPAHLRLPGRAARRAAAIMPARRPGRVLRGRKATPMRPEPFEVEVEDHRGRVEGLALTLLTLGSDQSVRVLEALAAALVNRAHQPGVITAFGLSEPPPAGFCHADPERTPVESSSSSAGASPGGRCAAAWPIRRSVRARFTASRTIRPGHAICCPSRASALSCSINCRHRSEPARPPRTALQTVNRQEIVEAGRTGTRF